MNFTQILQNIAQWIWGLISGIGNLMLFLFTPISETIQNINLPQWVITALDWLQGIFGVDVVPITLVSVAGIIIAVIVAVVKAFV